MIKNWTVIINYQLLDPVKIKTKKNYFKKPIHKKLHSLKLNKNDNLNKKIKAVVTSRTKVNNNDNYKKMKIINWW